MSKTHMGSLRLTPGWIPPVAYHPHGLLSMHLLGDILRHQCQQTDGFLPSSPSPWCLLLHQLAMMEVGTMLLTIFLIKLDVLKEEWDELKRALYISLVQQSSPDKCSSFPHA